MQRRSIYVAACVFFAVTCAVSCMGAGGSGGWGQPGSKEKNEPEGLVATEWEEASATLDETRETFDSLLQTNGLQGAIDGTVAWLGNQDEVSSIGIGADGTTITFLSHMTVKCSFFTTPMDNEPASVWAPLPDVENRLGSLLGQGRALVAEAPDFSGTSDSDIASKLMAAGFDVTHLKDEEFDLDAVAEMGRYDFMYVRAHGGVWSTDPDFHFLTGQAVPTDITNIEDKYGKGVHLGSYHGAGHNYFSVWPEFFEDHDVEFGTPSVLYLSSCHGLENSTMASSLVDVGLDAYVGWNNTVDATDENKRTNKAFVERLLQGATIGKVFAELESEDPDFGDSDYHKSAMETVYAELEYHPNDAATVRVVDGCDYDSDCNEQNHETCIAHQCVGGIPEVPPEVNEFLDQDDIDDMEAAGITIYPGWNPPYIVGNYLMDSLEVEWDDRGSAGMKIGDYKYTFKNQQGDGRVEALYYLVENEESKGEGEGGFISGEGDCFSVYLDVVATTDDCMTEMPTIVSGCMKPDGIAAFQKGFIMKSKTGTCQDVVNEGVRRVIYETDGKAEKL